MDADHTAGPRSCAQGRAHGLDAKLIRNRFDAVVFDLFGTLVDAPDPSQLESVSLDVAQVLNVPSAAVEQAITATWRQRHDGTLPTIESAVASLVRLCDVHGGERIGEIAHIFKSHAVRRLEPSPSVVRLLGTLKATGLKIGVLSDAAPEVADSWHACELATFVDNALFSCRASLLKPARGLYTAMTSALDVVPSRTLYCGDGGGDELRGAQLAGFTAVRVELRGRQSARAYGYRPWPGPSIAEVQMLPAFILDGRREGGPLRA